MGIMGLLFLILLNLIYISSSALSSANMVDDHQLMAEGSDQLQTYIVHVKRPPPGHALYNGKEDGLENWYKSFLPAAVTNSRMIYSYRYVINGFAAKLTAQEVKSMEEKEGFVSARPQTTLSLHTTHSPAFLGLHPGRGFWEGSNYGKGVIIGVLDTGIFPDHPSFSDHGVPPPPPKWKGRCEFRTCNNKVIGGRSLEFGRISRTAGAPDAAAPLPPIDEEGHGTHTASTAAGNFVPNADELGFANGTAAGIAPLAHLAIYRVCSPSSCSEPDVLAGFDAAIEDGVDVISISMDSAYETFDVDPISIGAFAAIQKGIFVSCSAGNQGPDHGIVSNRAPWVLTVGASTMDRKIVATAQLGNGQGYDGESLFQPTNFSSKLLPLVYPGTDGSSGTCNPGSLGGQDLSGKIVLCDEGVGVLRTERDEEVKNAGGAAIIVANRERDGYTTQAERHVLPATHVSYRAGEQIKSYLKSESAPTATIAFRGTIIGDRTAPEVASFSSRGPSMESHGILKPDILGPGVNILAAGLPALEKDAIASSKPTFKTMSGTSMACPHLSGVAALIKSAHPDWSPAAIKSAMMTSAHLHNLKTGPVVDETLQPADAYATGAGQVNPTGANDPGLVYDLEPDDYIPYLCGTGYTDGRVSLVVKRRVKCSEESAIEQAQLNYPSFSIELTGRRTQTYSRTVRNVGPARSTYRIQIMEPEGVEVKVSPEKLEFKKVNEKLTYRVRFSRRGRGSSSGGHKYASGFLKWLSDKHSVRSPIAIMF